MILGITGSFGSGKSSLRAWFTRAGWQTFDADEFCRDLYRKADPEFAGELKRLWGREFRLPDGTIDRKAVADQVFGAPEELKRLTDLIYPRLERAMDRTIAQWRAQGDNGAMEVPLLYENNMADRFDAVLTVWAEPAVRLERLRSKRRFSEEDFRRREALQMAPDKKLELADFALVNNGSEAEFQRQFEELLKQLEKTPRGSDPMPECQIKPDR